MWRPELILATRASQVCSQTRPNLFKNVLKPNPNNQRISVNNQSTSCFKAIEQSNFTFEELQFRRIVNSKTKSNETNYHPSNFPENFDYLLYT